jgi:pimeloyl-ACP methyl ester carboxylesterase
MRNPGDARVDLSAGRPRICRQGFSVRLADAQRRSYGSAHRAPPTTPNPTLWPPTDFETLVEAFRAHGFRPANARYLNDAANIAYAHTAPEFGRLRQPVLFINGDRDAICDINRDRLGEPMRNACQDLSVTNLAGGHWLPLERKTEIVEAIQTWLKTKAMLHAGGRV